jgi:hypothetical protein
MEGSVDLCIYSGDPETNCNYTDPPALVCNTNSEVMWYRCEPLDPPKARSCACSASFRRIDDSGCGKYPKFNP